MGHSGVQCELQTRIYDAQWTNPRWFIEGEGNDERKWRDKTGRNESLTLQCKKGDVIGRNTVF